ncbi:glycoside hydrolase family 76 [Purpureocillium lavendulum]|uniref:mannan endo-1,6-alpha-mannosidase n=1 Tax=Purpureocillium lavendulum TaxID=1247861 RepID=A0AB34FDD8_9HYPO|nr:glycoside hydrolase family 76 [Purpureocillium lavendulum]
MAQGTEQHIYNELRSWPRPKYPFQDLVSPLIDELADEHYEWIDADCQFESKAAREAHKRHRLTDIAARAFPRLSLQELRPIARFTAFLAILDDYMDHSDPDELRTVQGRILAILKGQEERMPEPGFYHQIYAIRQEALDCGMQLHLFNEFVSSIIELMVGYGREKKYNASNRPPPFAVYQSIRRQTSGGLCYAKYLCMQEDYRNLPDRVLSHPDILRMHDLVARIIGYHNDFISLPKELSRKGDVVNIVISIQHELGLGLKDAYWKALEVHDADLAEFLQLQRQMPDFGEWREIAQQYVADLGIMIQGVYAWHVKNTGRYVPGAYVEPEHKKRGETKVPEKNSPSHANAMGVRLIKQAGLSIVRPRAGFDADEEEAVMSSFQGFEFTFDISHTASNAIEAEPWDMSDTATLSDSVQSFPEEFGRTYHAFRAGSYAFPNDAPEQERLALQGQTVKKLLGERLYFAPLSRARPPLRILDIATGVGDWAIEMGDLFPATTIIATDLSPIQPESVPPNVHFYVEDSTDPWDFSHTFDYIHTRSTVGCWASFETQIAQQAFDALEPGGWFESQEVDSNVCCDDGTLKPDNPVALLFNDLVEASSRLNRPPILGATLKEVYERVGFVDVQQRGVKMPIGGWPRDPTLKEIGFMWAANLLEGLAGFSYQLLNRVFNRTAEEIDVALIDVRRHLDSIRNVAATIAHDAMSYYKGNVSKNEIDVGDLQQPQYYWWVAGALWGAMLDYYYYTKDPSYNNVVLQALLAPVNMGANHDYTPKAHELEEGNDDLFFWGSAVLSAAERNFPQPNEALPSWLDLATNVFNALISRWDTSQCGGGLRWQIYPSNPNGMSYKNSVSNGGLFQLAARLARATNNNTYLDWANRVWDWSAEVGFIDQEKFHVYDGADSRDNCSKTNYHSFTYTSGIYLYGAAVLADHTGNSLWTKRTEDILRGAGWFFSPFDNSTNVMYEAACETVNSCTADMTTFKGYLSRFMWQSIKLVPSLRKEVEKYLLPSAKAAASACSGGDSGHVCGQRWYVHGFDGNQGLGQQICALETIHGLLIDDVDAPYKGDKIKVVRDTKWVPLDGPTTTGTPTKTTEPQPTETEDAATVEKAKLGLVVVVNIALVLLIC